MVQTVGDPPAGVQQASWCILQEVIGYPWCTD